ncbi:hypothetical protein OVA03_11125 [Asticcacaulis sp. SL142]|uniref:hypothetical protein n=1 Tax=Asticcacaulis sp. SL142 TaxID=2995155 RepID=UPI00226D0401|nr:hypothetical protein [Asticcacaulis sp. SL142]WAC47255.1 hypothetical protein OVA03_11125 [Asticcacaulis sp. SL142]
MKLNFRLPPLNRMLPMIVGLLCVGLFATAALILISPSFDPDSPQSADAGAISPHGFKGIYKLLEARGYRSDINRRETGPQQSYDLEIITLEDVDSVFALYALEKPAADTIDTAESGQTASSASAEEAASEDSSDREYEAILARRKVAETRTSVSGPEDIGEATRGADKAKSDYILYDAQGDAVLIVLPKWQAAPHRTRPRWSQNEWAQPYSTLLDLMRLLSDTRTETSDLEKAGEKIIMTRPVVPVDYQFARAPTKVSRTLTLQPTAGQTLFTAPLKVGKIKGLQSVVATAKLTPILTGPKGEIVLARVNALTGEKPYTQPVYLLTDPDLLNNQILGDPQKVITALTLIDAVRGKSSTPPSVVFNLTFNGHSVDKSLLHHIATPPFIAVPLSFMVLGLGLMWAAFARFGPAHDMTKSAPLGRGVSILADNAARLLGKAGREPKLAPLYAQMMRDAALKARGYMGHATLSSDELADQLSARTGTTETYSAIARDATKVTTPANLISLCQRLHQWRLETGAPKSRTIPSKTES